MLFLQADTAPLKRGDGRHPWEFALFSLVLPCIPPCWRCWLCLLSLGNLQGTPQACQLQNNLCPGVLEKDCLNALEPFQNHLSCHQQLFPLERAICSINSGANWALVVSQIPQLLPSLVTGVWGERQQVLGRGTALPALALSCCSQGRVPSFTHSYLEAEFSPGRSVRALPSAGRKRWWNGMLQKEGKCSWGAGGKVVRWRSLGRLKGRWKMDRGLNTVETRSL